VNYRCWRVERGEEDRRNRGDGECNRQMRCNKSEKEEDDIG